MLNIKDTQKSSTIDGLIPNIPMRVWYNLIQQNKLLFLKNGNQKYFNQFEP